MIFITNKYSRIYFAIIEKARARIMPKTEYREKHHIIPKSMGGSDTADNLVELTAREHFICHKLLVKMTSGPNRGKMSFALVLMSGKRGSKIYTSTRKILSEHMRNISLGKIPVTNGEKDKVVFRGNPIPRGWWPGFSEKTLANKRGKNKGKKYITDGSTLRALKPNESIPDGWWNGHSDSHRLKNSQALSGEGNPMFDKTFITNGKTNKIISVGNEVPAGWRLGKTEKIGVKKSESKKGNKNPNFGKTPANAVPVVIDGTEYESAAAAMRAGYSRRTVEKLYKNFKGK